MSRRRSATLVRALVASAWGIVSLATGPVRADTLPRVQVLRDVSSAVGAVGSQLLPRPDGGAIVLGRTGGGFNSTWIAELSPTGDVERQVRVVAATGVAFINAIAATADGGLVLAGGIQASSPVDFLVVKLDANWAIQWQLSRGASLTDEIAQGVQPTVDGGWLVHGRGPAGALLLRLDASGGVIWQRQCVSPGARFSAQKLSPLGSDQWIMASNVSGSISGILVARLESDGTIDAARTLDSRGGFDLLGDVQALPDGGAWIVGQTTAPDGFTERATILRLDSNLLHRWARGYKLWFTSMRFVTALPTGVGGLITAGYAYVNTEPAVNAVVLEVDDAGNATMWSTFGGSEDDLITNVARVRGRWVVTGSTASMDGAASPDTAWLVALNEVLRPPTDCGLAVVESVFPADASVMATWVTITTEDATAPVSSGLTVTLETALLDSTIECVGPTLPPSEVSPPGSWTPLRITASGVLTWEDGALSSSEEFDIRRGVVSSLFGRDYGECLQAGVATPTWTDAEDPPSGDGWYYLVAGRNATGRGPLGTDWLGRQRLASVPCP